MAFEDQVIVKFIGDTTALTGPLKQVANQFSQAAKSGRATGGASQATDKAAKSSQNLTRHVHQQNRAVGSATSLMKELQSQTGDFTTSFRRAALSLQTGTNWLDKFSIQADRASMMMWKFTMAGISFQQLAAVTGASAMGMGMAVKKMVDSFSMVDRIKRQFAAIYQSAEMGGAMVDQLVDDAIKIRYTVEQTLEAGRLLALEGFSPKNLIFDMADLAAGVNQEGISIVNATRAFVDATNGQFRRLKETFQITREDAMAFAPDAFAGPNNQISNQAKATDAIIRAIRAKYRGMNEATMQTIGGMLSNVDDAMTKAMAKMGTALEGTITGWLNKLMVVFDDIGKFAETDLGKATAQTLLWGTAIMAGVTALSLLAGGMITLLGLFAAYKVFVDGRSGNLNSILNAEMELMKLNRQLALIEADRSIADIGRMKAQLVLLKAVRVEEDARVKLLLMQRGGVTGPRLSTAEGAVVAAGAARAAAQSAYNRQTLPREILKLEDEIDVAKAAQVGLDGEQLQLARGKTAELQAQLLAMQEQLSLSGALAIPGGRDTAARRGGRIYGTQLDIVDRLGPATRDQSAKVDALREAESELEIHRRNVSMERERTNRLAATERNAAMQRDRASREMLMATGTGKADAMSRQDWWTRRAAGAKIVLAAERDHLLLLQQKTPLLEREVQRAAHLADLANRRMLAERVGGGIYGVVRPEHSVAQLMQTGQERSILAMSTRRLQAEADSVAILLQRGGATARETAAMEGQLVVAERQLQKDRERLALLDKQAAVLAKQEALALMPQGGRGTAATRFGKGFAAGAGNILDPLLAPFHSLTKAIRDLVTAAKSANWAYVFGSILGMAAALVPIVTIAGMLYSAKKRENEAVDRLNSSLHEASSAAKEWAANLIIPAWMQPGVEMQQGSKQAYGDMREGIERYAYAAFGNVGAWISKVGLSALFDVNWDEAGGRIPYREHTYQFGKKILENTGGDTDKTKAYIREMAEAAKTMGKPLQYQGAELTPERINAMSEEQIKKLEMSADDYNNLAEAAKQHIMEGNKSLAEQQKLLDDNARSYAQMKLNAGGLSKEQQDFYQSVVDSTTPATVLSNALKEQYKSARDTVPEFESLQDALDKLDENGNVREQAAVFEEIDDSAAAAEKSAAEMAATLADMKRIGMNVTKEQEKELRNAQETARLLRVQADLKMVILSLSAAQNAQNVLAASGMGGMGAIFGADVAAGEWAAAAGEKDPKKKRERLQNAFKAARQSREDEARQSLDLYAPGPTASPEEKAQYERDKIGIEQRRMQGVEEDYQRAIATGNLTPEQKKRAETQIAAERRTSANAIAGFGKNAADIESNQQVGKLEAERAGAAVNGASAQQLAQMDMNILRAKLKVTTDETEQLNLQVQAAQILKGLHESALSDEEAKLAYMQEQADQGLIPQEAVDAEERRLAQMYMNIANAAAPGSAEYFNNMRSALQLLGDDTKDKWQGIIGQILGAPAELISRGVSEGWLARMGLDQGANAVGMGESVRASIVGQTNKDMTLRITWDDVNILDSRMGAAFERGVGGFVREFQHALSA